MDSHVIHEKVAVSLTYFSGAGLMLNGVWEFLNHNGTAIGAVCCIASTTSLLFIRHRKKSN